jgi:predicted nucleic acid-binding protein
MPLLVDTGVLYALADADDAWHERCRKFMAKEKEALLVPVTVLPEVTYLLRERLGERAERAFVAALAARTLHIENATMGDLTRVAELLDRYRDIGFVDASIVAMAERHKARRVATTDRRHFATIRPRHIASFELVP